MKLDLSPVGSETPASVVSPKPTCVPSRSSDTRFTFARSSTSPRPLVGTAPPVTTDAGSRAVPVCQAKTGRFTPNANRLPTPPPATRCAPTAYASGLGGPSPERETGSPAKCDHAERLQRPGPGVGGGSRTRDASGSIDGLHV